MKVILNPENKDVIFVDDKGYLVNNFVVGLTNPHTLFIKNKGEDVINSYKITFTVVYENGKKISVYDYEHKDYKKRVYEKTTLDILPDEQVEQYHFIPNDFLKDYKC